MASGSQESASLIRRLAGPSIGKAGLAKDQTEINRIIAEASKGSKFYENEKKKDKDLTERIARILHLRQQALKGVDISKVERAVDKLIVELEGDRDLSQVIVHFDMDAFFANVELLHNPSLKGKPFAVGGGVLSTASYEARKFGVRSGMPSFIAKKLCPELILLKSHYAWYQEESDKVFSILRRYDPNLSAAGCDEGYLNITPYLQKHGLSADDCVQEIRKVVHDETNLTVSAGIAPNKMIAKTCGDIHTHRATLSLMDKQFGLRFLLRTYLGIASNIVEPYDREERKSIGAERTFSTLSSIEAIHSKLEEVAADLEEDMQINGWTGRTVTLKFKLDTFQVFTRAKSLDRWISKKEDLLAVGKELLAPELPVSIRLIGLRVTKLKDLTDSSSGIKKFFTVSSPVKKGESSVSNQTEFPVARDAEQAQYEDFMPGFHEQDEADLPSTQPQEDHEEAADIPLPASHRTFDASVSQKPKSTGSLGPPRKARHSQNLRHSVGPDEGSTKHPICPICNEAIATDNEGLNAHIDYCLSRDAIQDAQQNTQSRTRGTGKEYAINGHKRLKLRPDT
ncbi:hypothetical protein ONZ45_g8064 [Pleurotus djamor]|nr:hypothetical protein ONZ45_g8064 [Pleurotus djamor]